MRKEQSRKLAEGGRVSNTEDVVNMRSADKRRIVE